MKLKYIYTDRYFEKFFSWHLIYEWEDILSKSLGLELIDSRKTSLITRCATKACNYLLRTFKVPEKTLFAIYTFIDRITCNKKALYIELNVVRRFYFGSSRNTIPIIIDFWKQVDLERFYYTYRNCPAVLITSLEAYSYLKENNCQLNLYHFPLSLPDHYRLSPGDKPDKPYDIIMQGRINVVLWHYLQKYREKFPALECLWQINVEGKPYCFSSKSGMIGLVEDRQLYMDLLRKTKATFYSTPGIDGGESRTGGFNPVTPRFLEILAAGCHVIGRYAKNEDTEYYEIDKICPSADDYSIFEEELNKALNARPPIERNAAYLEKHYTSATVEKLRSILNQVS